MHHNLLSMLARYRATNPSEAKIIDRFADFVQSHENCFSRELSIGHVTGSAWIIDEKQQCALFTHHKKLNLWLQLGGHADGDADILGVALKEAYEESGLKNIKTVGCDIFDLDIHHIPEHKGIASHEHFDVRFLFTANSQEPLIVSDESHNLAWLNFADIPQKSYEISILRMLAKTSAFLAPK